MRNESLILVRTLLTGELCDGEVTIMPVEDSSVFASAGACMEQWQRVSAILVALYSADRGHTRK
jgi:hypothetical protein